MIPEGRPPDHRPHLLGDLSVTGNGDLPLATQRAAHRLVSVPPLRETQLREVVSRPAELLSARFETDRLAAEIARRTAGGIRSRTQARCRCSPTCSTTCGAQWSGAATACCGFRRPQSDLGGVLVERANTFPRAHPRAEDALRRVLTLSLRPCARTASRRGGALRSEFSDEEWRLVSELADHPNRLLVTATPEGGETYAEVAHEAIFRRWDKLRDWIAAEREFLAWRSGLEAARRATGRRRPMRRSTTRC